GQNDTTLATRRVQQTEALGTLKKLDQQAFTHRPAIARLFTALSALDNAADSLPQLTGTTHSAAAPVSKTPDALPSDTLMERIQIALTRVWHQLVTIRHVETGEDILTPGATRLVILRLHG